MTDCAIVARLRVKRQAELLVRDTVTSGRQKTSASDQNGARSAGFGISKSNTGRIILRYAATLPASVSGKCIPKQSMHGTGFADKGSPLGRTGKAMS